MTICVAVDNNMGMMFNNRRQSQDRILRKYLLELVYDKKLWMNSYSVKQFESSLSDKIIEDDDFLDNADSQAFCFVENIPLTKYQNKIEKIILFKWNRVYPADTYFDISLKTGWTLLSTTDFEGSSHTKITMEEWIHENI